MSRLGVFPVLQGVRGREPANIDSLVEIVVRFSELAADCAGVISSLDLNPVIVGRERAVAVDVLAVPAS